MTHVRVFQFAYLTTYMKMCSGNILVQVVAFAYIRGSNGLMLKSNSSTRSILPVLLYKSVCMAGLLGEVEKKKCIIEKQYNLLDKYFCIMNIARAPKTLWLHHYYKLL